MKKICQILLNFFIHYFQPIFPYVLVFSASLFNPADSDLGWHIKYGEYFFRYGKILRENIFSSQMIRYQWINHSWLSDIITYAVFSRAGFFGITIIGALTITLSFYFIAQAARFSYWEKAFIFPLLIFLEEPLFSLSFRSQIISILGLTILSYLLVRYENSKKKLTYFLAPLFILWANIHGGFILGLGILFGWSFIQIILKKDRFIHLGIPLLSCAVTCINPFGIYIYHEALNHFGNNLQKYIIEWIALEPYSGLWWTLVVWGFILGLSIIIIYAKRQIRQNVHIISLTILLYILSFWMRRYVWSMYIFSVITVKYLYAYLTPKNKYVRNGIATGIMLVLYVYVISAKNPPLSFSTMNWSRYCSDYVLCSPKSAQFIISNNLSKNLFTFYNWGGWIIARYPEIKPSIDGRMPFWRDSTGYSAFENYYAYEQDWENINTSHYNTVWIPPTKPIYKQMTRLVDEKKWKEVYADTYASIFTRISDL
jgi:hypothetical protein